MQRSSCYIPVDLRKRVSPQIPEAYFGAATLTVRVEKPVAELITAIDSDRSDPGLLAAIALIIRHEIAKVGTDYVKRGVQLTPSVEAANRQDKGGIKLEIRHSFNSDKRTDVMLAALAPIFSVEGGYVGLYVLQLFRYQVTDSLPSWDW